MIVNCRFVKITFIFSLCILLWTSCSNDRSTGQNPTSKIDKLKVQPGFQVEHLYSPSEKGMGSWVAMTFDPKGRLIASDQYGSLYRLELAPVGVDSVIK